MFSGLPLEGPGNGSVDFRRSVSVPALAREKKLATQALMRATETGDVQALRRLTLHAGAEMSGCRALNRLGNDPVALLASSGHLTQEEQRRIRRQFAELPELAVAADAARAAGVANPGSRFSSKRSIASEVSVVSSREQTAPGAAGSAPPTRERTPAKQDLAATGTTRQSRGARVQLALTGLAGTVQRGMQDKVCQAALEDPRLLRAPQDLATQALQAIGRALHSEELALKAVARNPALLNVEALKFKKVLPVLTGIFGGHEEAAYAVAVQPEVLQVERPQQLREALRALVDCTCSMKDALWLVVQTLMPPSIEVTARAWCHEEIVGEYQRVEGKEVDERPMYLKPASTMKHLEGKAKDMYIRYYAQADGGSGGWLMTPMILGKNRYDPRSPSKSLGAAATRAKEEDKNAKCLALSHRTSPDQVPAGTWTFRNKETKAWNPDTNVVVADAGRPRYPGLLVVEPPQLRRTFDAAKEAMGICWRAAGADGHTPEAVQLHSCAVAGDATHIGGQGRFKSVGSFTQETYGYMFLQSAVNRKADSSENAVSFTTWEPICVTVLYCDKTEDEKAPPVDEEQPPEPAAKSKGGAKDAKGKDKGKGKAKEEAEAEPAAPPEPPKEPHVLQLEGQGFRPPRVLPTLPELEGLPPVKDVLCQCYPRGKVEFTLPSGPGKLKLPPIVFLRSQVCAQAARSGAACEVTKAKGAEPLLYVETEERRRSSGGDHAEAAAAAAGEDGAVAPPMQIPLLQSAGELGYNGYNFLRAPVGHGSCDPSEVLMRVDSADRIQVIFAQFRRPPAPAAPAEGEDAAQAAEAQEPPAAPPPPPAPPEWVSSQDWDQYTCRIPLTITTERGEQVTAESVYEKTFEASEPIALHGSGQDVLSVAFFRRVGDPRPDPLRTLLLKKPSLLATGDRMATLLRLLRVELGEVRARQVLMSTVDDWPGLVISGEDAMRRWVRGHKVEALAREVQSKDRAKALLQQPGAASVTAELLSERCQALREVLGGNGAMLDALARQPQLLAAEASVLGDSYKVLSTALGQDLAQQALRQRPEFLARGPDIAGLFAKLRERFPELAERRLREKTTGEWARWAELVGRSREALHDWMGRISAEERTARCQDPSRTPAAQRRSSAASQ